MYAPKLPSFAEPAPWLKYPRKVLVRDTKVVSHSQEENDKYEKEEKKEENRMPSGTVVPSEFIFHSLALPSHPLILPSSGLPAPPRFDKDTTFMRHTILGSEVEFANELKNRKLVSG